MQTSATEHLDFITGEIFDPSTMTDDELAQQLKTVEEAYDRAKMARDAIKTCLINRMDADGAKLRLTTAATLRLNYPSRVKDKKDVQKLYDICPEQFRPKCFAFDIRPLKRGLNELAKLGSDWQERVDSLYQETPSLKIEWNNPEAQ